MDNGSGEKVSQLGDPESGSGNLSSRYLSLKKVLLRILICFLVLLALECVATAYLYLHMTSTGVGTPEGFYGGLKLASLFMPASLKAKYSGKENIGILLNRFGYWKKFLVPDSLLGWKLGPNIVATWNYRDVYVTNEQGFSSIGKAKFYYAQKKPRGVFRVIMFGGSTVQGAGCGYPEFNLPAKVKAELAKAYPSRHIEVINAGVAGYSSGQEFLYLRKLAAYHPDLVLVYDGWNDEGYNNLMLLDHGPTWSGFETATHYENTARLKRSYTILGSAGMLGQELFSETWNNALEFAVVRVLVKVYKHLRPYFAGKTDREAAAREAVRESAYFPASVVRYGENLRLMSTLASEYGFRIAFFLQPLLGVGSKPLSKQEALIPVLGLSARRAFYSGAKKVFRSMASGLSTNSVCVTDLSGVFNDTRRTIYVDQGHINASGNEIVAHSIVESISRCGMMKSLKTKG